MIYSAYAVDVTEARNAVFTAGGPFLATGTLSPLTVRARKTLIVTHNARCAILLA